MSLKCIGWLRTQICFRSASDPNFSLSEKIYPQKIFVAMKLTLLVRVIIYTHILRLTCTQTHDKKLLPLLKKQSAEFRKKYLTRHGCLGATIRKVKQVSQGLLTLSRTLFISYFLPHIQKEQVLFYCFSGSFILP